MGVSKREEKRESEEKVWEGTEWGSGKWREWEAGRGEK